ncbi:MKK3 [Symbiodinium sp. CCMP2456]|nr:MKK3 [Symbiodinium sp. CCMP2456]
MAFRLLASLVLGPQLAAGQACQRTVLDAVTVSAAGWEDGPGGQQLLQLTSREIHHPRFRQLQERTESDPLAEAEHIKEEIKALEEELKNANSTTGVPSTSTTTAKPKKLSTTVGRTTSAANVSAAPAAATNKTAATAAHASKAAPTNVSTAKETVNSTASSKNSTAATKSSNTTAKAAKGNSSVSKASTIGAGAKATKGNTSGSTTAAPKAASKSPAKEAAGGKQLLQMTSRELQEPPQEPEGPVRAIENVIGGLVAAVTSNATTTTGEEAPNTGAAVEKEAEEAAEHIREEIGALEDVLNGSNSSNISISAGEQPVIPNCCLVQLENHEEPEGMSTPIAGKEIEWWEILFYGSKSKNEYAAPPITVVKYGRKLTVSQTDSKFRFMTSNSRVAHLLAGIRSTTAAALVEMEAAVFSCRKYSLSACQKARGPLQSDGEILAGVLLDPILRGSGRSFEEEQVDVERPGARQLSTSHGPLQVFQAIVEKALSLTAGPKEEASEGTPSHLLPEVILRRAERDRTVSGRNVINQRALERGLREKWGERLLSFLLPVASQMRCLSYEELRRLGFTAIPWKESDVRVLLNTLRDREVSPHKLQQVWDTLKWFSLLAIDEIFRLTEKKKSLSETLVSTVHRPMRKALVPSKAFVIQLEETAARPPSEPDSRIHLMDSFICGIVRFPLGTSARFSDLQHTNPDTLKVTSATVELAAWQTKTHSAVTVKKKPVPLICPKYSFSGKDWWTPLIATWRKLAAGWPWQFPSPTEEWLMSPRRIGALRFSSVNGAIRLPSLVCTASAQLYWGRMAAILLRIAYAVFPEVDWGFVFVDDFAWLLRKSSSSLLATSLCLLLLALGTPLSWKKTLLAEVNTWLGFVIDPKGPCVQMARDKHLLVVGILEELKSGKVMSASQIASALGRLQWATTACPRTKPFLQPFWAWKKACLTAGRPGKLIRAFSALLLSLFDQKFRQASPYAPLAIWSGASDASASDDGSAFVGGWLSNTGCPKKRIAALEMFGTLVLAHFLMEKAPTFIPNLRIPLVSDNQGNAYSLLNDKSKKMPTSVILMEILLQLHVHGMQLAPSHIKRDFNTWADELTHPNFHGFTPSLRLPVKPVLKHFSLVRSILEDRIFDEPTDLTHGPVQGTR